MGVLGCLWNRPWLERYVDRALGSVLTRSVAAHLARCARCSAHVERHDQLQRLVKSALADVSEPDWAGFWPGVLAGIARDRPRAMTDPWWIPLWRPFWGHPRLALSSALAAGLALAVMFWPVSDNPGSVAWAGSVVVQDVSTPDPDQSVMVYESPDQTLTVIWLFDPSATTEES